MDKRAPGARKPVDATGDGAAWGPSLGYLALALALLAGGLAWWWVSSAAPDPASDAGSARRPLAAASAAVIVASAASAMPVPGAPAARIAPAPAAAPVTTPRIPRLRDPTGDQTPDLADYVNEGEQPSMAEVIARLHQAGVHTGLGAFSPPGTRPPMIGLAVPETFVLPEGYVRHHQATDDGQRIEAILMFAPGYQLYDAAHRPLAMPPDRVVPPELAPPGLPLRRIVIPAPTDARGG